MSTSARAVVEKLIKRTDTTVAFVSGRSLHDLRSRCNFPDAWYAGNHGLEIETPDVHFVHPAAAAARPVLHRFFEEIARRLRGHDVFLEDKTLSLSIHYRAVESTAEQIVIKKIVYDVFEEIASDLIRLTHGKRVVEVRPVVDWNKGAALEFMAERIWPAPCIIYAGDDVTDEDAFAVVRDAGTGILVAESAPAETAATQVLPNIESLVKMLEGLAAKD